MKLICEEHTRAFELYLRGAQANTAEAIILCLCRMDEHLSRDRSGVVEDASTKLIHRVAESEIMKSKARVDELRIDLRAGAAGQRGGAKGMIARKKVADLDSSIEVSVDLVPCSIMRCTGDQGRVLSCCHWSIRVFAEGSQSHSPQTQCATCTWNGARFHQAHGDGRNACALQRGKPSC